MMVVALTMMSLSSTTLFHEPHRSTTMTDQSADRPNWNCYDPLPHNHWRKCACRFLEPCQSDLWSNKSAAQSARRFLRNRGFTRETLKRAGIGLNIKDRYRDRSYWGLPIGAPVGPHGRIWLPRGLVFPWFDDEGLSRLDSFLARHA